MASSDLRLAATMQSLFGRSIRLRLVCSVQAATGRLHVDGQAEDVDLPVLGSGVRQIDASLAARALEHDVRLDADGTTKTRRASDLAVLADDPVVGAYVEVTRLLADVDHIFLARGNPDDLLEALEPHLRDPPTVASGVEGLPAGWRLVTSVQPDVAIRLTASGVRTVKTGSAIQFSGGLRLPDGRRTYHASMLPSAVVRAPDGEVHLEVTDSRTQEHLGTRDAVVEDDIATIALTPWEHGTGDFTLTASAQEHVLGTATVRVRTAGSPRKGVDEPAGMGSVGRSSSSTRGLLAANDDAIDVVGAISPPPKPVPRELDVRPPRWSVWTLRWRNHARSTTALTATPDAASTCDNGRPHVREYRPIHERRGADLQGTCVRCGSRRLSAAKGWSWEAPSLYIDGDVESVAVVEGLDYDILLDALTYLGSGRWAWFERLIRDRGGDKLAVDNVARRLEALGHLEVGYDDSGTPAAFAVPPPALSITPKSDTALLSGARSRALLDRLERVALEEGVTLVRDSSESPTRICLQGRLADLQAVAVTLDGSITPAFRPDLALATQWVSLGLPADMLRRTPRPADARLQLYDLTSGSWIPSDGSQPGAYRLRRFGHHAYALRTPGDVEEGTIRLGPHSLVRHLAARQAEVVLVAYEPTNQTLFAPRNVGLPSALERAAVLCTGYYPQFAPWRNAWVYRGVPEETARAITSTICAGEPLP